MDEDGPRAAEEEPEPGRAKTFIRLNDLSGAGGRPGPGDREAGSGDSEAEALPYPALAPVVFFYLSQESRPRSWCLRLVSGAPGGLPCPCSPPAHRGSRTPVCPPLQNHSPP
uniref:Voltage-dependent T-type calcium channel subunit alpha-1G n=1 Tax=Accipiter nisus TaxID=211598 RepID=A0A8B9NBW2_9AVES